MCSSAMQASWLLHMPPHSHMAAQIISESCAVTLCSLGLTLDCCSCRCMPPAERTAMQRTLIVAGPSQLARHTIEEATESAERLAQRASTTFTGARVQERQQIQAARDTQEELDAHFISVSVVFVWCRSCLPSVRSESAPGHDSPGQMGQRQTYQATSSNGICCLLATWCTWALSWDLSGVWAVCCAGRWQRMGWEC